MYGNLSKKIDRKQPSPLRMPITSRNIAVKPLQNKRFNFSQSYVTKRHVYLDGPRTTRNQNSSIMDFKRKLQSKDKQHLFLSSSSKIKTMPEILQTKYNTSGKKTNILTQDSTSTYKPNQHPFEISHVSSRSHFDTHQMIFSPKDLSTPQS